MGVELPALRVLYAIAYSAITILAWEAGKSIVLTHSYDCGGEESCSWRRAAQLQVQIGASNPREDVRITTSQMTSHSSLMCFGVFQALVRRGNVHVVHESVTLPGCRCHGYHSVCDCHRQP